MTVVILMMLTMISVHWDQTTDRRPFTPVFLFPAVPMILANTSPLPLITFYITFLSLFFSLFSVSLKVVFLFPDACQNLSLFCLFFCIFFSRYSPTRVPSFIILLFFCVFDTLLIFLIPALSMLLARSSDAFSCSQFDPRMIYECYSF